MPGYRKGVGLLVAAALAGVPAFGVSAPGAQAAGLEQCSIQPRPADQGEAEIGLAGATWKRISKSRVTHRLIRPGEFIGGRPVYPVRSGAIEGATARARLAGGFTLTSPRGARVKVVLTRLVRNGTAARIEGRVNGRKMTVLRVRGSRLTLDRDSSRVEVTAGRTVMAAGFARIAKRKAGLRQARNGLRWGSLYTTWIEQIEPEVDEPPLPDPFERPEAATDLAGATLTWRVRESWIQYVASGDDPAAIAPAIAGAEETIAPHPALVYEFTFPFSEGWVEDGPEGVLSASVKGTGGVSFRYCGNAAVFKGLNFVVRAPELEVESDVWRLIFEVEGLDGTPFTGARAVVVEFDPSGVEPTPGDGGLTSWESVPGSVPSGASGVFGGFYGVGAEFGSIDLQIDREEQG